MAATGKIILVKRFTYRGQNEEWSNTYHFTTTPTTSGGWDTAFASLAAKEKLLYPSTSHIVRAYGYEVGADVASYVKDYTAASAEIAGTYANTDGEHQSGDVAATVRWFTGVFNSRGRKVYLRKYFHDVFADISNHDNVAPNLKTAIQTFASAILGSAAITGMGSYCGPDGDVPTTGLANSYLTTRTLKRRGKRNPT